MKMISSAKVHKNETELKRLLPFRDQIKSIMSHLLDTNVEFDSPLIKPREVKKIAIVVFGSDDGLCGAYNINIFKSLLSEINSLKAKYGPNTDFTILPVGKKMVNAVKKIDSGQIHVEIRDDIDSKMDSQKVTDFTESLRKGFVSGEYDLVKVCYMRFFSMSRQRVMSEQLFPVESDQLVEREENKKSESNFYIFEPDPNSIFNAVLPMFVLSMMQEITIENRASEQAARVMAMQSANDNAKKLLEELQLEYNKLRQQAITTELLDILGGQIER